jgi:hypothetical protein
MTKRERRQKQLEAHYAALVRLAEACGIKKADGKKLSVELLKIERLAHGGAEAYCNGDKFHHYDFGKNENDWDDFERMITACVQDLFNHKLPFFQVNGDARGYALKIRGAEAGHDYGRELIEKTGLQRDWGGNGLLAPDITGA